MNVVVLRTAALPFTALHRLCTTAIAGFLGCGVAVWSGEGWGGDRGWFANGDMWCRDSTGRFLPVMSQKRHIVTVVLA